MDAEEKEIRTVITCILTSSPLKMTVRNLGRFFKENEGYDIPYRKFGHRTLTDYLLTLTDKVQVTGYGDNAELTVIVGEKSAHIAQLISKQKITPAGKRKFRRYNNNRPMNYYVSNTPREYTQYITHPPRLDFQYSPRPLFPFLPKQSAERNRFIVAQPVPQSGRPNATESNIERLNTAAVQPDTCLTEYTKNKMGAVSTKVLHELSASSEINQKCPNNRGNEYSASDQFVKNTMSASCTTATSSRCVRDNHERMESREVVNAQKHSLGAVPKSYVLNDLSDSEDELFFSDDEVNIKIPKGVQDNLRKLISKADDGIWCAKLPDLYKQEFGTELDYSEYGYRSIAHMCGDMRSVFRFVQPNMGDVKLFDMSRPISSDAFQFIKRLEYMKIKAAFDDVPEPELVDILDDINVDVSCEIIAFGEVIPRQWIDSSVKLEGYIDVKVGEVYDPSKFWFSLRIHSLKLDALMDSMQEFYRHNWKVYAVPLLCLKPGLYVAVMFLNEYHRGKVLKVNNIEKGKIKVFYVDYGTVATVPAEGICYLHKQFCDLPEQAIRGRLSGIYPPIKDEQWCINSSKRFLNLVSGKNLVAQVLRIDEKIETLHVLLVDTSTSADFFINDALVNEGYAIYSSEKQQPPLSRALVPTVKYIHLFPTFVELECGLMPNLYHMENLRDAEIEIQSIYKHYFIDKEEKERVIGNSAISYSYEDEDEDFYQEEEELYPEEEHLNVKDGPPDHEHCEESKQSESWIELCVQEESELESTIEKLKETRTSSTPGLSSISPVGVGVGTSSFQEPPSPRFQNCAREQSPPIVKQFLEDFAKSTARSESPKKSQVKPPPGFDGVVPVPQNGNYIPTNSTHFLQQNLYFPNYVQPNYVQPQFVQPNFPNLDLFIPPNSYQPGGPYVPYQNIAMNEQMYRASEALLLNYMFLQNLHTNQSNLNNLRSPPQNNSVRSTTENEKKYSPEKLSDSSNVTTDKLNGSDSKVKLEDTNVKKLEIDTHSDCLETVKVVERVTTLEDEKVELIQVETPSEKNVNMENFKLVKLVELAKIPVHIVRNDNEFGFILDEITQIFLGKAMPIKEIRMLSIGTCYHISISDINLRKAEQLKAELLGLGLIDEHTTTLSMLAVQYIRQLANILLKKPKKIQIFEDFLKDTMALSGLSDNII